MRFPAPFDRSAVEGARLGVTVNFGAPWFTNSSTCDAVTGPHNCSLCDLLVLLVPPPCLGRLATVVLGGRARGDARCDSERREHRLCRAVGYS